MEKSCIFCIVLIIAVAAQAIDWNKECTEGSTWKDDCHTCRCTNGKPVCTRELCDGEAPTNYKHPQPANTEKTECKPGEKWVEDCNNCICDNDGLPECSRRLCA